MYVVWVFSPHKGEGMLADSDQVGREGWRCAHVARRGKKQERREELLEHLEDIGNSMG